MKCFDRRIYRPRNGWSSLRWIASSYFRHWIRLNGFSVDSLTSQNPSKAKSRSLQPPPRPPLPRGPGPPGPPGPPPPGPRPRPRGAYCSVEFCEFSFRKESLSISAVFERVSLQLVHLTLQLKSLPCNDLYTFTSLYAVPAVHISFPVFLSSRHFETLYGMLYWWKTEDCCSYEPTSIQKPLPHQGIRHQNRSLHLPPPEGKQARWLDKTMSRRNLVRFHNLNPGAK